MALDAESARVHTAAGGGDDIGSAHTAVAEGAETEAEDVSANVVARTRYREGDAGAALAASDAVVERPASRRAGCTRPTSSRRRPRRASSRTASSSSRRARRRASSPATGSRRSSVSRGRGCESCRRRSGGGFGGKLLLIEPLAAGAALALRRPVRLSMTRSEDFLAGNPNPGGFIELEIGGMRSGELTGLSARVVFERGMLAGWGIEGIAATLLGGVYRWPAFDVRAYGVETNRPGMGAYRAPGAPPAHFALESAARRARRGSSASTRSSSGCATPSRQAIRCWTAGSGRGSGSPSASSRCASTSCGAAGPSCPRTRGSGSRSASGRVPRRAPRQAAVSTATAA